MIQAIANDSPTQVVETTSEIVQYLAPVVISLHSWNAILLRNVLARGMALEVKPTSLRQR